MKFTLKLNVIWIYGPCYIIVDMCKQWFMYLRKEGFNVWEQKENI
jgi:hypothetical protein